MIKVYLLLFSLLTLGAGYLTYHDIGLQETNFSQTQKSVRSSSSFGSTGGNGYYGSGNGGYRPGK